MHWSLAPSGHRGKSLVTGCWGTAEVGITLPFSLFPRDGAFRGPHLYRIDICTGQQLKTHSRPVEWRLCSGSLIPQMRWFGKSPFSSRILSLIPQTFHLNIWILFFSYSLISLYSMSQICLQSASPFTHTHTHTHTHRVSVLPSRPLHLQLSSETTISCFDLALVLLVFDIPTSVRNPFLFHDHPSPWSPVPSLLCTQTCQGLFSITAFCTTELSLLAS